MCHVSNKSDHSIEYIASITDMIFVSNFLLPKTIFRKHRNFFLDGMSINRIEENMKRPN